MLGLRVWQTAQPSVGAEQGFCYRLGHWLLVTQRRFEQQQPGWHADVLAVIAELSNQSKESLAEVSVSTLSSWPPAQVLDLRTDATEKPQLAQLKQALWQQLSQSLPA
ncbi:MAG: Uncharacterised protein [Pseudidiomarina mangrovi]|nr:MAG: Uncharacterised protein [Pseudidiomarina mangrovi]